MIMTTERQQCHSTTQRLAATSSVMYFGDGYDSEGSLRLSDFSGTVSEDESSDCDITTTYHKYVHLISSDCLSQYSTSVVSSHLLETLTKDPDEQPINAQHVNMQTATSDPAKKVPNLRRKCIGLSSSCSSSEGSFVLSQLSPDFESPKLLKQFKYANPKRRRNDVCRQKSNVINDDQKLDSKSSGSIFCRTQSSPMIATRSLSQKTFETPCADVDQGSGDGEGRKSNFVCRNLSLAASLPLLIPFD